MVYAIDKAAQLRHVADQSGNPASKNAPLGGRPPGGIKMRELAHSEPASAWRYSITYPSAR